MCLACELDALWYAEWERLAAEGAGAPGSVDPGSVAPGTAGVPPALAEDQAGAEAGGSIPLSQIREWVAGAGETPAVPAKRARPAAPRSGFLCEETE
jgi:hypothetical protein